MINSRGTVPHLAAALPGYLSNIQDLAHQDCEITYLTIPSTSGRNDEVARFGYANLDIMNPAARTLAGFHKYMTGGIALTLQVYGAANKTGSLMMGWVPDITQETFTIKDLQQYANWRSVTFTAQARGEIIVRNADDTFRPREIG